MNSIFGMPMNAILYVLVSILAIAALWLVWVAWRRPVIFKLGVRNLPRRRAQTVLIVVGLMLSTMIISASLGVGDTLDRSVSTEVYDLVGHLDELVVYSQDEKGEAATVLNTTIDAGALPLVEDALRDDPNVDGIMPGLFSLLPVVNPASGQAEPEIGLVGWDPARIEQFGGLRDLDGEAINLSSLPPGAVVIGETTADDLEATVGDSLTIYYDNRPVRLTVAAIAPDSALTGAFGPELSGMVMALRQLQTLTGQQGALSLIAISNAGGVRDSLGGTDAVVAKLKVALVGQSLGYQAIKQELVDETEEQAEIFTSVFLVMGLFSISAGILLIVLIFTMLAAERRSEMGIARAIGTHRTQLVQEFVAEGTAYAVFAGLIGAALGVLASIGIALGLGALFGDEFQIEPYVRPRSLVVAYCLGMVITFIAVLGSSWRISRLNVVAAIRDIPEAAVVRRSRAALVWAALLTIFGSVMTVSGVSAGQGFAFYLGMSLLPFGIALALRYFGAPGRLVFTVAGLFLLTMWLLPEEPSKRLFGSYDTGIEMFFLSGIFMVLAATIVIIQNSSLLLAGVTRIGGLFRSQFPAVRTAIAYPAASRGRTGMTIAMFSLIVFSLVTMATLSRNFTDLFLGDEANAGWDVRADALTTNPIDDFTGELAANGVDTSTFTETASVTTPHLASQARLPGNAWKYAQVRGMDDAFVTQSELAFQQRAAGYETDADVIQALLTEPNVAVIDSFAVPGDSTFGQDPDLFMLDGLRGGDKSFEPITVEVADPDSATPARVRIIGVIDSKIGSLLGIYANQATVEAIYPDIQLVSYFIALSDPGQADSTAKEIEAALLQNGVQATSIQDELEEAQRQSTVFLYIFQGFMGLGLIVGIAAVGVIAFRMVVERRQQIGVLRAVGYQRSLVARSFLIETGYIVGLGVLSGTALALVLSRNLFGSEDFASASANFSIPWAIVLVIVVLTLVAALLMTWVPAQRAARIAPAEALRYE
jgi:putative ABC transport system permease protein